MCDLPLIGKFGPQLFFELYLASQSDEPETACENVICRALGLDPERIREIDRKHNGEITVETIQEVLHSLPIGLLANLNR